jgi:FkbM family methyltransferase
VHATDQVIETLIGSGERRPVLVDVGASGGAPPAWRPFARHCIYIGFDPDGREIAENIRGEFFSATILNQAIADVKSEAVPFYLTQAPQCSSLLRPNSAVLANYPKAERFNIEREVTLATTDLGSALHSLAVKAPDWLKLDTQGADLRIYRGLSPDQRSKVLVLDAEPGLRGAYLDEDLFGDVHRAMIADGLWLASTHVKGYPRIRDATLRQWSQTVGVAPEYPVAVLKKSACWVECRYYRSIEAINSEPFSRREYCLLWAFALRDEQLGFAADVMCAYHDRFGRDELLQIMCLETSTCWRAGIRRQRRYCINTFRRQAGRTLRCLRDRLGLSLR